MKCPKTQEERIKCYERRYEKVKSAYTSDYDSFGKNEEYIEYARKQLEEVKNGRDW
jgi:hypothetical protein